MAELDMIVITGANGQLGRQVVLELLERVPASQIAVSVRDPQAAAELADRGVRVRRGDFADPASLQHAFEGATRALVISASELGDKAVTLNSAAIDAAVAAGAQRVLYTSHVGAATDSPFPPMPTHAAVEAKLVTLDVPATILRNGFYATSAPTILGDAATSGELHAPADGPVSFTTHDDLAAATAAVLADADLDEPMLALTAAEAVDADDLAKIASELAGRPIRRVVVPDDAFRERLLAAGAPAFRADMALGLFQAARRGDFARVDPALERLIGRAPTSMRDVLADAVPGSAR